MATAHHVPCTSLNQTCLRTCSSLERMYCGHCRSVSHWDPRTGFKEKTGVGAGLYSRQIETEEGLERATLLGSSVPLPNISLPSCLLFQSTSLLYLFPYIKKA